MIKRFLSILTTVVLLIACSESNLVEKIDSTLSSNEINFSVFQVEASRAVETTTSTLHQNGNSIAVTAIQHNGKWNKGNLNNSYTIMDNVQVTYNSGTWSYSPVAYWPTASGSYVSFFSYYPVSDEDYNGLSKSIAVDHNSGEMSMYLERVGANPIDQDVIYAVESNLSNANGGSVQFHYEHLLSKLNFKVSVSGYVSAITINSIGLKNFASEGIYNYVNNNISQDYVINTTDELMLIDEPLTLQGGQTKILESQLMLPQSLLAWYTDGNSPAIVINYVVSSNGTQTESSLTYSLEKGFDSWDSGNSYTYTLKINSSSIIIDGEVGDFEDNGNADINPDTPVEPGTGFEAPEADYVLDVKVVQDNGWGATYFALDGTDVTGRSKYEDAAAYVNPVAGVSVDITAEIEAALGLEIGTLKDELLAGSVYLGSYNANNEFMDCYEVRGSNYFFWFEADGSALSSYAGYACIDNLGFVNNDISLYGTTLLMPNKAVAGATYSTYIVFKTEDAEYVVQVNEHAVEKPEIVPLPEFQVVKTYEKTYTGVNPGAYTTPDPIFTLEDIMPNIESMIGGEPDMLLMSCADGTFQTWTMNGGTDGWFGANGAARWGTETQMFCLHPNADGTFSYCAAIDAGPVSCKCTYRYANSATLKAVDVVVTVALTAKTR